MNHCLCQFIEYAVELLKSNWFISFSAASLATYLGVWASLAHNKKNNMVRDANLFIVALRNLSIEIRNNLKTIYPDIIGDVNAGKIPFSRFTNDSYKAFIQNSIAQKFTGIGITVTTSFYKNEIDRINRFLDKYDTSTRTQLVAELQEIQKQLILHKEICIGYTKGNVKWKAGGHADLDKSYYEKLINSSTDLPVHFLKIEKNDKA